MVEFTTDFLTSWRLEGYTHVTYRQWHDGYVTLCPHREELPVQLRILFDCECYPIYSPLIDAMAASNLVLLRYLVSDSYTLYRNFDEDHIDLEADY